jgi:hypothetical protein
VREGFACTYGSVAPLALPVFFISVPRSGADVRAFALEEAVGPVETGASGFEFLVESFIWFPLA